MTNSGLSPSEREDAAKNRRLSEDTTDPMNKVHSRDGAVGVSVMEF